MRNKYQIIYADPPWNYKDQGCSGTMANHYAGMRLVDICNLKVNKISADNSILFLWATYPMLKEALTVIEAWGFKYKSIAFLWVKLNRSGKGKFFGLGRWTRGNSEICLLATKGKPQRKSASVFQIIETPIQRHSQKPEEARTKIIELMGDLKKIELFAREKANTWDVWGNEVNNDLSLELL